jgi:hypothetical protein
VLRAVDSRESPHLGTHQLQLDGCTQLTGMSSELTSQQSHHDPQLTPQHGADDGSTQPATSALPAGEIPVLNGSRSASVAASAR